MNNKYQKINNKKKKQNITIRLNIIFIEKDFLEKVNNISFELFINNICNIFYYILKEKYKYIKINNDNKIKIIYRNNFNIMNDLNIYKNIIKDEIRIKIKDKENIINIMNIRNILVKMNITINKYKDDIKDIIDEYERIYDKIIDNYKKRGFEEYIINYKKYIKELIELIKIEE